MRLMNEGRIPENAWERRFYELATKLSGAVQASRWSFTDGGGGYIYSLQWASVAFFGHRPLAACAGDRPPAEARVDE